MPIRVVLRLTTRSTHTASTATYNRRGGSKSKLAVLAGRAHAVHKLPAADIPYHKQQKPNTKSPSAIQSPKLDSDDHCCAVAHHYGTTSPQWDGRRSPSFCRALDWCGTELCSRNAHGLARWGVSIGTTGKCMRASGWWPATRADSRRRSARLRRPLPISHACVLTRHIPSMARRDVTYVRQTARAAASICATALWRIGRPGWDPFALLPRPKSCASAATAVRHLSFTSFQANNSNIYLLLRQVTHVGVILSSLCFTCLLYIDVQARSPRLIRQIMFLFFHAT